MSYPVHSILTRAYAKGLLVRAIKRINNNAAICVDNAGHQLIALGKGIGFGEIPREVSLADIHRTFYGIDSKYLSFIDEVDPQVLEFAAQFADVVTQQVSYELSSNLPITLADHFQFALKRAREHMMVPMPLAGDVEQSYPVEYRLGEMAVHGLERTFNVRMPPSEVAGVALSIVNAMVSPSTRARAASLQEEEIIDSAVELIEQFLGVTVDRDSFAYARFVTHIRYLLGRMQEDAPLETDNVGLFDVLEEQYPETTSCAQAVGALLEQAYGKPITHEELLYLAMHINRVIVPAAKDAE